MSFLRKSAEQPSVSTPWPHCLDLWLVPLQVAF